MEKIGWRTARLCANETHIWTAPITNSFQYFGDARFKYAHPVQHPRHLLPRRHRAGTHVDDRRRADYKAVNSIATDDILLFAQLDRYALRLLDDATDISETINTVPAARHIAGCYEGMLADRQSLARMPHWFFADW